MASQQSLNMIANPTGGGLTNIGQMYQQAYAQSAQNRRSDAKAQMLDTKFKQEQAIVGAKITGAYARDAMSWMDDNPDALAEEARDYQLELMQRYAPAHQKFIPERLQTRDELQLGLDRSNDLLQRFEPQNYKEETEEYTDFAPIKGTPYSAQTDKRTGKLVNIKASDGFTAVGTSEFERGLRHSLKVGKIDQKRYDELVHQRTEGFAGEMTKKDITKHGETVRKAKISESSDLREEYGKGVEHFKQMDMNINEAIIALDSGNTGLSDTMLNRVLAQVQDDNIRAYAAMQQFDKPFGNVANRVAESIERFFTGKRSDEEKAEIKQTLSYFQTAYATPKRKAMRDRYRAMAVEGGHDPFTVVPPSPGMEGAKEVRDSTLVDKNRKKELLRLYYPEMFQK